MRISFKIGQSIVFSAYVVQIVLGLIWMVCNIHGTPMEVACIVLQILIAYGAGVLFVKECMNRYFRGTKIMHQGFLSHFGALAFLTIPQCMQCHMTVSKTSIASSLLMVVIAVYLELHEMKYLEEEQKQRKVSIRCQLYLGWFLVSIFQPFYGLLLFPILLVEVIRMWRQQSSLNFSEENRKRRVSYSILLIAECLGLFVLYKTTPGSLEQTLAINSVSRFEYIHMEKDYGILPVDIHDAVGLENTREAGRTYTGIREVLVPVLDEHFGNEGTTDALWRMAKVGFMNHGSENTKQILWDIVGYQFPAFVVPLQLKGRGYEALTGYNYSILTARTPKLGAVIIRLHAALFVLFLLGGIGGLMYAYAIGQRGVHLQRLYGMLLIIGEALVLYYALRGAGQMDYRNTCPVTIFLCLPGILLLALRSNKKEEVRSANGTEK